MLDQLTISQSAALLPALVIVLKSSSVLLIAFALTALMRRASATSRHLVWVATLLALLAIPALAAWSPIRFAVLPSSWGVAPRSAVSAQQPASMSAAPIRDLAVPQMAIDQSLPAGAAEPTGIANERAQSTGVGTSVPSARESAVQAWLIRRVSLVSLALIVWGTVLAAILGWLVLGALSVRRIVRDATPLDAAAWQSRMIDIADRFELANMPRLLRSASVTMPFACGLRTPTIVLPGDCEAWTSERRTAVLLHELAHIRRRDIVGHTVGRLVCAIHWFNPLAWMAAKRLRAESERACDDLALGCGTRASDYAEHLLDLVTSVRNHGTPSVAMAMATRSEFEGRMLAILDPSLMRAAPTRVQASTLAGGVMMFAIVTGSAVPRAPVAANPQRVEAGIDTSLRDRRRGPTEYPNELPRELPVERPQSAESVQPVEMPAAVPNPRPSMRLQMGSRDGGRYSRGKAIGDSSVRATVLARILRTDTAASLRRTAAWGLNDFADEDVAVDALVNALRRDQNAGVREMAAWSLAYASDTRRTAPALAAAIRADADRAVRETAVWSLSEGADDGTPETIAALSAALTDEDPKVRELAAWGLGNASPKRAPAALVSALSDRSERVRRTVAWALFQIEDAESANAIEAALQREMVEDVRWALVRALAVMGDRAVEPLQRIIESGNAPLRALAIRSLAGRGPDPWPQPRPRPRPFP
jgi:beta-lactamase regulating signal transducer with metallopeptidase domain/HEAT repeat protein